MVTEDAHILYFVFCRAAQRNRSVGASSPLFFAGESVLGLLGNILIGGNAAFNPYNGVRKWGSKKIVRGVEGIRNPVFCATSDLRSTLTVPGVELVLAKASVPHPCLTLHIQGLQLRVPMSDETMCHLSAVALAEIMPFYC